MPIVAIASTFTCDPVRRWAEFWLEQAGLNASVSFAAYGQLEFELRGPQAFRGAACCVGLLRMDDWQRGHAPFDADRFEADLSTFLASVRGALANVRRLVICICPGRPSAHAPLLAAAAERLNALASSEPRLAIIDALALARQYAVTDVHDALGDEIGHMPYTEQMWCALGAAAVRGSVPALLPPLKLVVVDCDYTLWSHALGEVGPRGVACEAHHLALQRRLKQLHARGVLLAIASRNEPDEVWQALGRAEAVPPDASAPLLRRCDVSAHVIAPVLDKGDAVARICAELQCGPEACLFVDDNPMEVAAVSAAWPSITCWTFPQNRDEALSQLEHVWRLDVAGGAADGAAELRVSSILAQGQRRALREQSGSLAEYHASLGLDIRVEEALSAGEAERAEGGDGAGGADQAGGAGSEASEERLIELHQRTNQFNAWKRPLPAPALLRASSSEAFCVRVADRYGSYGLAGGAVLERRGGALRALSFCMSCRVLGRGVEHRMLRELGERATRARPACTRVAVGVVGSHSLTPTVPEPTPIPTVPEPRVTVRVVGSRRNLPLRRFLEATRDATDGATLVRAVQREGGGGGAAAAEESADSSFDAWAGAPPEVWYDFPARALAELVFDPEAAAAAAKAADAHGTEGGAGGVPGGSGATAQWSDEAPLAGIAERLARIPRESRSVGQAMQARGAARPPLPFLPRHGASAADALSLLRGVWQHVLDLEEGEAAALSDSSPFGAFGGDSVLAVAMVSLAAKHGLTLAVSGEAPETMTMGMLVEKGRSWRGERWARPERQQRRAHSARALRCEGEGAAAGEAAARSAAAASLSSGGRRAVALSILERDGRDTQMPLRPIGGIGACAVGDLAKARGLAADAGWLSAHAADKHGSTALMWASGGGHLPVVRWLCEEVGVAVDAANKDRRTALQWACKTGQCEVAAYLLDVAGADPTLRMKDGSSAFDWAVLSGDVPSMELLASHPRVDIAALNKFGCAAVQWAAAAGSVATLRWLQSKRLSLGHVNDANHGAVVKAAWKGRREALEWLLLAADGPQLVEQLDLLDLEGRTVADLARQNGQGHVATWLDGLIRERSGGANGVGTS